MNLPQTLERIVWTFINAAIVNLGSAALLDVDAWKGAALAGGTAVLTYLSLIARTRLSVLPDPGDGLPGLEVDP